MKKHLAFVVFTLFILFGAYATFGLTPDERKIVQHAKTELTTAQADYTAAKDALAAADQRAADAEAHATDTDKAAAVLKKQTDDLYTEALTLKSLNAKMQPVYDACTKWFGAGAIIFGVKDLLKHLMWFALGAGVLVIALYALSFAFPILGIVLAVVVRFFTFIFHGLNSALRALEAHLRPK
jgi:hypothetical protein